MSMQQPALIDAPVSCACCCVAAPLPMSAMVARTLPSGAPACEICGRQLTKVKHTHRHGPGHACHPRCKRHVQTDEHSAATASVLPPKQSRKRRATSDPGQSPEPAASQSLTRRVTATEPSSSSKMQYNTRRGERIMRLLEETHARRMAAEAAAGSLTCL